MGVFKNIHFLPMFFFCDLVGPGPSVFQCYFFLPCSPSTAFHTDQVLYPNGGYSLRGSGEGGSDTYHPVTLTTRTQINGTRVPSQLNILLHPE